MVTFWEISLFVNFVVPSFSLLVTKTDRTVVVITPVPVHCLPFISSPESKAYKVSL